MVEVCSQKYYRKVFKIIFSNLACSQIWLNLLVDHHHFGFNTKLTQTKHWAAPPPQAQ
jgi:hypothetical protein